jgi:hypothetical protein
MNELPSGLNATKVNTVEIRLYFESFEQARHFILPAIQKAIPKAAITFIRLNGGHTTQSIVAKSIAPALALRDPDGLVTVVRNGIELPILWIEFTTQVETDDHTLQGFGSLIAAGGSRIPIAKIVAARQSSSKSHGGTNKIPWQEPFRLIFQTFGVLGVRLEWPLSSCGTAALRDSKYQACPPISVRQELTELIAAAWSGLAAGKDAVAGVRDYAASSNSSLATNLRSCALAPATQIAPLAKTSRTRLYATKSGDVVLKFNRWKHAMDPERGMADYYSLVFNRKLKGRLEDKTALTVDAALRNFLSATGINLLSHAKSLNLGSNLDISTLIGTLSPNRPGCTILNSCDEFTILNSAGHAIVCLTWNSRHINIPKKCASVGPLTVLSPYSIVDEDRVTYAIANDFYPKNGFSIHSVSYPGAQGDQAFLTGSGRTAKRTYFDIIATRSKGSKFFLSLTESKGAQASAIKVADDVTKMSKWATGSNRLHLLGRVSTQNTPQTNSVVVTSVAVPSARQIPKNSLSPDFIIIVGQQDWQVWLPAGKRCAYLNLTTGLYSFPSIWTY